MPAMKKPTRKPPARKPAKKKGKTDKFHTKMGPVCPPGKRGSPMME